MDININHVNLDRLVHLEKRCYFFKFLSMPMLFNLFILKKKELGKSNPVDRSQSSDKTRGDIMMKREDLFSIKSSRQVTITSLMFLIAFEL